MRDVSVRRRYSFIKDTVFLSCVVAVLCSASEGIRSRPRSSAIPPSSTEKLQPGAAHASSDDRGQAISIATPSKKRKIRANVGKQLVCSLCSGDGHNKRTCPQNENKKGRKRRERTRFRTEGVCSVCSSRDHNKRTCPVERELEESLRKAEAAEEEGQLASRKLLLRFAEEGNVSALHSLVLQGLPVDGAKTLPPSSTNSTSFNDSALYSSSLSSSPSPPSSSSALGFETPLHRAAVFNQVKAVSTLLELGAIVNAQDEHAFTPLHVASSRGFEELADVLIAKAADVNAREEGGFTPLHYASKGGWQNIVNSLMIAGGDVDARSWQRGLTPLMLAAMCGEEACVLQLAYGSADFKLRDGKQRTAEAWATALGHVSCAQIIRTLAAHPDTHALLDPGDQPIKEIESLTREGAHEVWEEREGGLVGPPPVEVEIDDENDDEDDDDDEGASE